MGFFISFAILTMPNTWIIMDITGLSDVWELLTKWLASRSLAESSLWEETGSQSFLPYCKLHVGYKIHVFKTWQVLKNPANEQLGVCSSSPLPYHLPSLPLTSVSLLPTPALHFSLIIWSCHVPLSHKPTSMPVFPFHNSSHASHLPPPFHFVHGCTVIVLPSFSLLQPSVSLSEFHPSRTSALLLGGSPDLPIITYPFLDIPTNFAISPI